ncbi:MAG: alpha/beta hydrolase [Bacteroidetes bacterium]|nr:alpha/beta hydrolase [Bacteroidota bacterium]
MNYKIISLIRIVFSVAIMSILFSSCMKESPISNSLNPVVKYTDITNAKIAYKVYGTGDPLIMCMGYATNMDMWSTKAIELLQKKYSLIVFDYRGMGFSTNTDTAFTIGTLADDVNELLISLKIAKTHVLGWSMGGYVAQMFAINHPEKVNKLVLYATNGGDTITVNPSQEIIDILSNPSSTPTELLSTLFPDDWLTTHPEPWKFLPEAVEPYHDTTIGLQYFAVQQWLTPGGGSVNRLNQLSMPVLLICGDQDKVVPHVNSSILADSIHTSTLIRVPDSGHGMMYQLPETFANYVLTFLAD